MPQQWIWTIVLIRKLRFNVWPRRARSTNDINIHGRVQQIMAACARSGETQKCRCENETCHRMQEYKVKRTTTNYSTRSKNEYEPIQVIICNINYIYALFTSQNKVYLFHKLCYRNNATWSIVSLVEYRERNIQKVFGSFAYDSNSTRWLHISRCGFFLASTFHRNEHYSYGILRSMDRQEYAIVLWRSSVRKRNHIYRKHQ